MELVAQMPVPVMEDREAAALITVLQAEMPVVVILAELVEY